MNYSNPMEGRRAAYARSGGGVSRPTEPPAGAAVSGGEDFVKNTLWIIAVITLIGLGLLVLWFGPRRTGDRRESPWKESFADAESARDRGDRYRALEMYIYSARMASATDDWRGQLAIACGLQKLGKTEGPSLYGFNVIVSAMGAAERQKSADGMKAAADAFASLGASYASFALSRIGEDWQRAESDGTAVIKQRTFAAVAQPPGC